MYSNHLGFKISVNVYCDLLSVCFILCITSLCFLNFFLIFFTTPWLILSIFLWFSILLIYAFIFIFSFPLVL